MDKMKETSRIVLTISIYLFIAWWCGLLNYNIIRPHETADPAIPYVVTADGKSLSLLSGYENLSNALGNYCNSFNNYYAWNPKLITSKYYYYGGTCSPFFSKSYTPNFSYFALDPYGEYPNDCSIYNGLTTASTMEELETAFGTDCIKTDKYYVEIFIDDKEFDYSNKQDYPADFFNIYYSDYDFDKWFEHINKKYSADTIIVLMCSYHDNSPNDIEFFIYPEVDY